MRVRPSAKENLNKGGVTIRVFTDTRSKLRELCARRGGLKLAECLDRIVDEMLQAEYDREGGGD